MSGSVDTTRLDALARATQRAGVWNVPTEILLENLASDEAPEAMAERPEFRYLPARFLEQSIQRKRAILDHYPRSEDRRRFIEVRRRTILALHRAGAGLLLGSDSPQWWNVPGFSVLGELEALVAGGLTPYEALATGTRNVAAFLGVADRAGTIAVGKQADLLLLEANPLEDIANVWRRSGVMVRGQWLSGAEVERRLAALVLR